MKFPSVQRHFPGAAASCAAALLAGILLSACGTSSEQSPVALEGVFANPAVQAADLGWETPDPDYVRIEIELKSAATGEQKVETVSLPAQGAHVSGLSAGSTYVVTLRAFDAQGRASAPSAPVSVRVPRLPTLAELADYQSAASYSAQHDGEAVLVMRDGAIVFEDYQNGFAVGAPHALASGTKSFSCALLAAAEADGYVQAEERVADTLTEWRSEPNKAQMTVGQLLSLQGGLSGNPEYSESTVADSDTYQLALDDSADNAPGEVFFYDPLAFQAFALLFERRSAGRDPVDYLQEHVFAPIGVGLPQWQRDAVGHPQMAGGARMSARDWMAYGRLMLQGGTWQTQRVLDADAVARCFDYPNPAYAGYGLSWWLNRPVGDTYDPQVDSVPLDGRPDAQGQLASSQPENMVVAAGAGRQRLYLLPDPGLVVVRFGPLDSAQAGWSDGVFLDKLTGQSP